MWGLQTTAAIKFLTPYANMELQQTPHLFRRTNIVHLLIDMGIILLSCVSGVRSATTRLLINTLSEIKYNIISIVNKFVDHYFYGIMSLRYGRRR